MMKIQNILLPTREEIISSLRLAQANPEELSDRELWILEELGGDF